MRFTPGLAAATVALVGAASAKELIVEVSNQQAGLFYNKNDIRAAIGDTVKFIFNPLNHSVTESSFGAPCRPLAGGLGFNSGFHPTKAGASEQDTFTIKVTDDLPHWFYCAQGKHCESGMVGVINPPAAKPENNINSFTALAKRVNATIPDLTVKGGWLGKISAQEASGYLSQANPSWTPVQNGTAPPTGTPTYVYNTNSAAPTAVISDLTYTSNGQVYTSEVSGTATGWVQTTYTSAYTQTDANGQVQTGVATGVASIPQIAKSNEGAVMKTGAAAFVGALAGAMGLLMM